MSQIGVALVLLLFGPTGTELPPQTSPRVGLASVVERDAKAQLSETIRLLILRDPVFRNERLTTGVETGTLLHLRLLDETVLTLGPSSEMVLDDFAINPDAGTAEVQLSVSRGLLRFVGGKHAGEGVRYRVKTPVATIGVRGTSFNLRVEDNGSTAVQLEEGELVFENALGDEVLIDDPYESSSIEQGDSPPSEPEIDMDLAEAFESLDLSPEQEAVDAAIAGELEDGEIEPIEGEDPDDEGELEAIEDEDAEDEDDEDENDEDWVGDDWDDENRDDEDENGEDGDDEDRDEDQDSGDEDDGDEDGGDDEAGDDDGGAEAAADEGTGDGDADEDSQGEEDEDGEFSDDDAESPQLGIGVPSRTRG